MNTYNIKLDPGSYKKLQKKLSKYNIKIGGMSIRNFLVINSIIDDRIDSTAQRVKRIILHIAGDFDSNPANMKGECSLEQELSFGYNEYFMLRRCLDRLVKEYNKKLKINADEIQACRTVEACVNLVTDRISNN